MGGERVLREGHDPVARLHRLDGRADPLDAPGTFETECRTGEPVFEDLLRQQTEAEHHVAKVEADQPSTVISTSAGTGACRAPRRPSAGDRSRQPSPRRRRAASARPACPRTVR